ncbi:MAG: ATP-binding protein [Bacteroidia bacterium]|nr:ATP-binding protein [Bacteroidia bacterium]
MSYDHRFFERLYEEGRISKQHLEAYAFGAVANELGIISGISGLLSEAIAARKKGKRGIFVHPDQVEEAAIVNELDVLPVSNVNELIGYLEGKIQIEAVIRDTREIFAAMQEELPNDMADIIEDENVKHALEIAAIGRHHTFLYGDPRSGKDRLVEHLPATLPRLSLQEALEVTKRFSQTGQMKKGMGLIAHRPLVKMGPYTSIDEVRQMLFRSHLGILWIQDMAEVGEETQHFISEVLATGNIFYFERVAACRPMIVATSTKPEHSDKLTPFFDLFLEVPIIEAEDHLRFEELESSLEIRERVEQAFKIQEGRFSNHNQGRTKTAILFGNGDLNAEQIKEWVQLDAQTKMLLNISLKKQGIDPKLTSQVLRVSRSIADRVGEAQPLLYHVAEAIHYMKKPLR